MKTTIKFRFFATTLLMAAIVAGTNFEASAQNRENRNGKKEERRESPSNQKFNTRKRDNQSQNDRSGREVRPHNEGNRYSDAKPDNNYRRRENEYRNNDQDRKREPNYRNDLEKQKKPNYQKHYDGKDEHATRPDSYVHPKYGRTYRSFHNNPFVLNHNRGRYYYYDGHFCDYRPGIGYVIIDIPYLTVFTRLPFHCNRVKVRGRTFYQYGSLYFEALPVGYRLVPSPIQINISAHF